jgi:hypothetical protein
LADEFIAVEIIGVFAVMFVGIVVAVLWFTHATTKVQTGKELKEKQMDIIDRHWNEMVRIECPYCKTIYRAGEPSCPGCGANTKKILFPEMPE